MRELNEAERANVALALENLAEMVASLDGVRDELELSDEDLARWRHISENLSDKLTHGRIHPVDEMNDDDGRARYRHWDGERWRESHPTGAYCDQHTQVWNEDEERWENCEPGDILVDGDLVHPRLDEDELTDDGAIDSTTEDGWKAKWQLLHVLVHEKMHEVLIGEQIELLELGEWVPVSGDDAVAMGRAVAEATRRGSTAEKHAEVYQVQKALLVLRERVSAEAVEELERREDELEDRLRELARRIREARRRGDDDAREELEVERDRLHDELDEIQDRQSEARGAHRWRRRWLRGEWESLQDAMRRATASTEMDEHRHCRAIYGDLDTGAVALALRDPSGFERFDLRIVEREVTKVRLTAASQYGLGATFTKAPPEPDLYVEMPTRIYTGLFVQPAPCAFAEWAVRKGHVRTSSVPFGPFLRDPCAGAIAALERTVAGLRREVRGLRAELAALEDRRAGRARPPRETDRPPEPRSCDED